MPRKKAVLGMLRSEAVMLVEHNKKIEHICQDPTVIVPI